MCDYSQHDIDSRDAVVGDRLISTTFPRTITRGFAACDKPGVAVCLRPGAELAFEKPVTFATPFGLGSVFPRRFGNGQHAVARFRKINEDYPHKHHDALEFPDGRVVLLTRLTEKQRATVLQMPHDQNSEGQERLARARQYHREYEATLG